MTAAKTSTLKNNLPINATLCLQEKKLILFLLIMSQYIFGRCKESGQEVKKNC